METWKTIKEKAESIFNTVVRNSPKGSYWEQYSSSDLFGPVESDRYVLDLCAIAENSVVEHRGNLENYVNDLEAKVSEYEKLRAELDSIDRGPMTDELFNKLSEWANSHDNFTPYKLYGTEFILAYCKGILKQMRQATANGDDFSEAVDFFQDCINDKQVDIDQKNKRIIVHKGIGLEDLSIALDNNHDAYWVGKWLYHQRSGKLEKYNHYSIDKYCDKKTCSMTTSNY